MDSLVENVTLFDYISPWDVFYHLEDGEIERCQMRLGFYRGIRVVDIIVLAMVMWAGVGQAEISRNPYLSFINDPDHSMVISWGTDTVAVGLVEYGTDTLYQFQTATADSDTIHHVELIDLQGNTRYYYRVISDMDTAVGDFLTAPSATDSFSFIAYGDSRTAYWIHQMVVSQFMEFTPRLVLNAGDLVEQGEYWEWDVQYFGPAADALSKVPFIDCVGGHDADTSSIAPYFTFNLFQELMAFPGNELYFSFDYGPIHVTVLNSEVAWQYGPETEQTQWLVQDLAHTDQRFRIVMFHMPPYTSGSGNPNNMLIRQHWCPIFQDNHVQMVINGHQHYYQRCEPGDGVVYVITGGGGAGMYYPNYDSSYVVSAFRAHHFLHLEVSPDSIYVTAIDTSETEIDHFSIYPWFPTVPELPENVTIRYDTTGARLLWNAVRHDTTGNSLAVDEYRIYRNDNTPYFLPDSMYLAGVTPDTAWVDTTVTLSMDRMFYRVTAVVDDD